LRQAGTDEPVKATVPGTVHTDLLVAGKIPDPYFRDNEDRLQWIGEADWIYRRTFEVPEDFLPAETDFIALRRPRYPGRDKNKLATNCQNG